MAHHLIIHGLQFLQPKHTMNGFEWKNQRGIEGVGFVRALRTLLTSRLPILLPKLERAIENQLSQEMQKHRVKDGNVANYLLHHIRTN